MSGKPRFEKGGLGLPVLDLIPGHTAPALLTWTRSPCSAPCQPAAVRFRCFKASPRADFYRLRSYHKWRVSEKVTASSPPAVSLCPHPIFPPRSEGAGAGTFPWLLSLVTSSPSKARFPSLSSPFPPSLGSRTASSLSKHEGKSKDDLSWAAWKCSRCFSPHTARTSASCLTSPTRNWQERTQYTCLSQIKSRYLFHPPNGNIFVLSYKSINCFITSIFSFFPQLVNSVSRNTHSSAGFEGQLKHLHSSSNQGASTFKPKIGHSPKSSKLSLSLSFAVILIIFFDSLGHCLHKRCFREVRYIGFQIIR